MGRKSLLLYTHPMGEYSHFFNQHFQQNLIWRGQHKLRMGTVLPSNKEQISRSLRDLSSESIRNRFLGTKKEFSEVELDYLTKLDGHNHYAIGIEERENPHRGVAIARLVRSSTQPEEAEIAITIIDEFQNMGLGSLLIKLIALAATERDLERLSFTSMPQNNGITRLIQKIGPYRKNSLAMDYVQYFVDIKDIDIEKLKSQLVPHLPSIGTFGS